MEKERENENLHLIRNDNGEWISDEYAVFVSKVQLSILQSKAAKMGITLSVQHGPNGSLWCYKQEIQSLYMRGLHDVAFKSKLMAGGSMRDLIDLVQAREELVLQIRDSYINIYYEGGNVAKISSEDSVAFDINYLRQCEDKKSEDWDAIKGRYGEIIQLFKQHRYQKYIDEVQEAMKHYDVLKGKGTEEKITQHQICLQNSSESEYAILDLEYQVSKESKFHYRGERKTKTGAIVSPRFDIIAIRNKDHRLCVIELKKGTKSLPDPSGVQEHAESYAFTIGFNEQSKRDFIEEMYGILLQKRDDLEIMDKSIEIDMNLEPEFLFAYQFDSKDKMYPTFGLQKKLFKHYQDTKNKNLPENYAQSKRVIWLDANEYKLKD